MITKPLGQAGTDTGFATCVSASLDRAALPSEEIARQSVERFRALASVKYMAGQQELVQKVRLEHLEEEIIDLWHYVYALRLKLKDG